MAAGITGYDTSRFLFVESVEDYIWPKSQISEDRPKFLLLFDFAEMVEAIHNAFAKNNEDQDEIKRACIRGVQRRVNLCSEHQGGHFEKFMTSQS